MSLRFSLRRSSKAPAHAADDPSADTGASGTPGKYAGALRYRVRPEPLAAGGEAPANGRTLEGAYDHTAESAYDGTPEIYGPDPTVIAPTVYEPAAYGPDYEDDESWLAPDTRRRVRMAVPTFALGALVVIAGAFWGGAEVDKHFGVNNTSSAASLASALGRGAGGGTGTGRGGFAGLSGGGGAGLAAGGGGGFGGGFGSTPAASGTLSAISGDVLTVKATTGKMVKVVLSSSTLVTRIGQGSTGGLKVGDTLRVQGTTGSGGTVTASSITAIAAGVTTGGFGGLGGGTRLGGGASGAATGVGGGSAGGSTTQTTVHNGGFSGDGSGVSGG